MTRFASPETYLATPIQAFMPDSPDYGALGVRMIQQDGMDEVNQEQSDLIRREGEFIARQIERQGAQIASRITDKANNGLFNAGLSLATSVAGAGMDAGWFGGGGGGTEITGLTGSGIDQASFTPGIDKLPTLGGSPSPTSPVFGDSWIVGDRIA